MPYASENDIRLAAGGAARFTELTDWNGDGVADPDVIARAQAVADAFINPYLRNRYTVPIAAPTEELKQLAAAEAVFWLRTSRNQASPEDMELHKLRIDKLEEYRSGINRPDNSEAVKSDRGRSSIVEASGDLT